MKNCQFIFLVVAIEKWDTYKFDPKFKKIQHSNQSFFKTFIIRLIKKIILIKIAQFKVKFTKIKMFFVKVSHIFMTTTMAPLLATVTTRQKIGRCNHIQNIKKIIN